MRGKAVLLGHRPEEVPIRVYAASEEGVRVTPVMR